MELIQRDPSFPVVGSLVFAPIIEREPERKGRPWKNRRVHERAANCEWLNEREGEEAGKRENTAMVITRIDKPRESRRRRETEAESLVRHMPGLSYVHTYIATSFIHALGQVI